MAEPTKAQREVLRNLSNDLGLEEALRSLVNESEAILSNDAEIALRRELGNTNVNVFRDRIKKARAALRRLKELGEAEEDATLEEEAKARVPFLLGVGFSWRDADEYRMAQEWAERAYVAGAQRLGPDDYDPDPPHPGQLQT